MKLLNGEIFQTKEPLEKLLQVKMPVRASYALAKLALRLNEQLRIIEDVRNGLIRTYGKESLEAKGRLEVTPESSGWEKFVSEVNELMMTEVEMDFDKVKLPEKVVEKCSKCEAVIEKPFEIEASVLMALEKFVEVE